MLKTVFRKHFIRFSKDDRGTSAIEFALTAPFLLAILLFTIAANDSINASTEIGQVTSTVADIIAQAPTVTAEVIDGTFDAADVMVNANRLTSLELYVTGVEINADGTTEVLWSRDNGNLSTLTKPTPGASYELSPEVTKRAGFIVSARARMRHVNVLQATGMKAIQQGRIGNVDTVGQELSDVTVYDYESNFAPRASIRTFCSDCTN